MERLYEISAKKIENISLSFKRFLTSKINWKRRLIGIKGSRGTGKTTMLLQHIKENFGVSEDVLYVSLDNIYFTSNTLVDLADRFEKTGGKYLFIDEVHKYPGWSREIKNIYDDYPELKIVFTGSSILEIDKSEVDLSRRSVIYDLPVLSLREYLELSSGVKTGTFSLSEIIKNHREIATEINKKVKPIKEFNQYNRNGCYPFFTEAPEEYYEHLLRIINLILETDLPAFASIDYYSVIKIKQLLYIISESVPFQPNIKKLSIQMGISRETFVRYLHALAKTQLISLLQKSTKGISKMGKPEKIYLNNSNLLYALQPGLVNEGTIRETFFQNQVSVLHKVEIPPNGDFVVDDKYVFEVGGRYKTKKQIVDVQNAFIVSDDIEYGFKNRIPLWMFGFLY